ncbi:MAG TPA: hypothetical protein VNI20_03725 [Fimbriimonadaceae bacterium]|nr:hypothetical protein [Fimbriimonadaceae bacterium]
MPSKRRKSKARKTKRFVKPADPAPWLWSILAVNILIGLLFSPVTSLATLRVDGANPIDQEAIGAIVQSAKGAPALRVDRNTIQSAVERISSIEQASLRVNVFGRGVLTLNYRTPIATVAGSPDTYLSDSGTVYVSHAKKSLKGVVEPPAPTNAQNLSVFGAWRSAAAAKMCENMVQRLPDLEWRLVVAQAGYVSLQLSDGGIVEFVSFDDTETKVAKLAEILHSDPKLFQKHKKLNLSSPLKPTVEP